MTRKLVLALVSIMTAVVLAGCLDNSGAQARYQESVQQGKGVLAIVQNQPVPDLGGWSLEREIVRQTYLARNQNVATYSYLFTMDGKIVEVCASIGYPIPYSTQLTNPEVYASSGGTLPQAEPTGLYPPSNAAATLVQCAVGEGKVSPVYIEDNVLTLPYRIRSDYQFARVDETTSFTVDVGK